MCAYLIFECVCVLFVLSCCDRERYQVLPFFIYFVLIMIFRECFVFSVLPRAPLARVYCVFVMKKLKERK